MARASTRKMGAQMARYRDRGYGEGAVWRDVDAGKWRGRIMVNGQRRQVSAKTRGEVERKLDVLAEAAREGAMPEPDEDSPTVGAWLRHWVDELAPTASKGNRANRQWAIDRLSSLHGRPMDDVRTPEVERALASAGLGRSSLVRLRSVLAMAYDTYNGRTGGTFNPARLAKIPRNAAATAERRALSVEQVATLLEAAAEDRDGIAVVLGYYLGMRPGEVCGLMWADVDLEGATVTISQMRRREPDGSLTFCDPKAKSGRTFTHVRPEVMDALRTHKAKQTRRRLASRGAFSDHGLVLCNRNGTPVDPSNHRRALNRMATAAGIFDGLTPNELRHTFATHAVASGKSFDTVAAQMGHKNARMVLATYNHAGRVVDMSA